jgi:hypothetical protein
MVWATLPFLSPPQGLMPSGWTEAQLIQDRYPFHLVSTTWVSDVLHWSLTETFARIGAVVIGVICVFVFARVARHKKPTA